MSAGYLFGFGAIVLVATSPLLHRFYIGRFWVHARGTVIRLDGAINLNAGPGGGTWVWMPVIEYEATGRRLTSKISYWQRFNAKSRYAVGDEVQILYDPRTPSRVMLDSWTTHIFLTIFISGLIAVGLRDPQ
jgi:hypothetical protein